MCRFFCSRVIVCLGVFSLRKDTFSIKGTHRTPKNPAHAHKKNRHMPTKKKTAHAHKKNYLIKRRYSNDFRVLHIELP